MVWIALGEYRGQSSVRGFVRYLIARYNREIIDRSYRHYVTDSLRLIPQMSYITETWMSLIEGSSNPERTAEEIIDDIAARLEA